jgi:large subunit ribosomal protein L15
MPLQRRLPKRGFHNIFKVEYTLVHLSDLNRFDEGFEITPEVLREKGLVKKRNALIKVLADGDLEKPLSIRAHKFSQAAIQKIEARGGKAQVIGLD